MNSPFSHVVIHIFFNNPFAYEISLFIYSLFEANCFVAYKMIIKERAPPLQNLTTQSNNFQTPVGHVVP